MGDSYLLVGSYLKNWKISEKNAVFPGGIAGWGKHALGLQVDWGP